VIGGPSEMQLCYGGQYSVHEGNTALRGLRVRAAQDSGSEGRDSVYGVVRPPVPGSLATPKR
jgi:hypothetical protein